MKASALDIIEKSKSSLMQFSSLVDQLQNKQPDFIPSLERWMKMIETIFKEYNIAEQSEIAGLRSKILSPLLSDMPRVAAKKKQLFIASENLYHLQATVLAVIKPYEFKVDESTDLVRKIMGLLKQTDAVKYHLSEDFQGFVNKIWQVFLVNEQLKPSAMKILTLVSHTDAIRIIAEEIELSEWM